MYQRSSEAIIKNKFWPCCTFVNLRAFADFRLICLCWVTYVHKRYMKAKSLCFKMIPLVWPNCKETNRVVFAEAILQQISMEKSVVLCPLIRSNFWFPAAFSIYKTMCMQARSARASVCLKSHGVKSVFANFELILMWYCIWIIVLFYHEITRLSSKWCFLHMRHFLDVILKTCLK